MSLETAPQTPQMGGKEPHMRNFMLHPWFLFLPIWGGQEGQVIGEAKRAISKTLPDLNDQTIRTPHSITVLNSECFIELRHV
jgi:hypothetical protein